MQLLYLHNPTDAQRLDDIITAYTPRVRRICPALGDAVLQPLIERMAQRQLANERSPIEACAGLRHQTPRQRRLRPADVLHLRAVS